MDWVRITTTLPRSPKVLQLATALKCKRHEALGLILEYFCWLDGNFSDGFTHLTPQQIDEVFARKKFAKSLLEIGWASLDEQGCFVVQSFDTYNGASAKKRVIEAEKKRKQRQNLSLKSGDKCPHSKGTKVPAKWGPDKIRDNNTKASNESLALLDPQTESKKPPESQNGTSQPDSEDAVLTYMAALPNCGLRGEELLACVSAFFNQSEALGWTLNGQPIRDWRAAARAFLARWLGNNASRLAAKQTTPPITYRSQTQQHYDLR